MIVVAVQAPVVLVLVVGLKEIVLIIGSHACVIGTDIWALELFLLLA